MRALADAARIRQFMSELARAADRDARVYFTGGAMAVLFGWRSTTIDVDIKITPESDRLLQATPLAGYYEDIEPQLYHYPAVDPAAFRRVVTEFLRSPG